MCGKTQCVRPAQTRLQNSGVTGPSSSYLYGTDLKCSQQCIFAYKKAIRVMGMIRRTISYKEPKIMLSLYKTLVRPHVEYCSCAWNPHYMKDKELLERIQRRLTKMINDMNGKMYEDRLWCLRLWTL